MVGYFTVNPHLEEGYLDWDWLLNQEAVTSRTYTKQLQCKKPIVVQINGHQSKGIILKPEVERE
jgi:hypothetical protein